MNSLKIKFRRNFFNKIFFKIFYENALNVAAFKGNADVVALLLERPGINVNAITVLKLTFFYVISLFIFLVKFLINFLNNISFLFFKYNFNYLLFNGILNLAFINDIFNCFFLIKFWIDFFLIQFLFKNSNKIHNNRFFKYNFFKSFNEILNLPILINQLYTLQLKEAIWMLSNFYWNIQK